ncbi:hypothetical protein D6L35_22940 [Vibrio parahaemolyticus]|nr:hypothetical protein [Vibrio parahaemolyticus]HCG9257362.1 hypothetical protein [Vibrio parahaemolyticus]HCH4733481.1 hypothetical protein [Vibrio parahaemolyticus]
MKLFKLLLISFLSLTLITPSFASPILGFSTSNECQFESLKPLHARAAVALFGNTGATSVASEAEKDSLATASSEVLTECVKPFPNLSDSVTYIILAVVAIIATVMFSMFLISNTGRSIFTGLFNRDKWGSAVGRIALFTVGSSLVLPLSPALSYLIEGKGGNSAIDLDDILSPAQTAAIEGFGGTLNAVQNITNDIVNVEGISTSQYRVPDAQYVARETGYNLNGYNYNSMSSFIEFARCTTEKNGRQAIEVTLSDLRVNVVGDQVVAEVGSIGGGCHLRFSTPSDNSPAESVEDERENLGNGSVKLLEYASAYKNSQADIVETLTRELLRMALSYQYAFYDTVIASNRNNFLFTGWRIEPSSEWKSACPADGDLSKLFDIEKPSRWSAGQIIEIQRQAELCMADVVAQKLSYPEGFSDEVGRFRLHKTCGTEDLDTCLARVCSIDATAKITGLFECAAAIDSKIESLKLSQYTDLGFLAIPTVLMKHSETKSAPLAPQKVLSGIKVEAHSNLTSKGEHDTYYREINQNYLAAADASYSGLAEYLPKRSGAESVDDKDIFGITPLTRCLRQPNTIVLDDAGDLQFRCGSVISELSNFGSRIRSLGTYYYLGRATDIAASKMIGDKLASENDGGIDSGNKPQEKSQSTGFIDKIKRYGVGIFGAGIVAFIDSLGNEGVDVEESPYSIDTGSSWVSSLASSSAFIFGYVMNDGGSWLTSPAVYFIFLGATLEFGLPYGWIILGVLGFLIGLCSFVFNMGKFGLYLVSALSRNEREMHQMIKKTVAELVSSILYLAFFTVGYYFSLILVDWIMPHAIPILGVVADTAISDSLSAAPLIEAMLSVVLMIAMLIFIFSMCTKSIFKFVDYSKEVMFESTERRGTRMTSNSHGNLKQKAKVGKSYI